MGGEGSKLGIFAMSVVSGIEKEQIASLQLAFKRVADATGSSVVARADFDKCIQAVEHLQPADQEILDRLFTLIDHTGDNEIDGKLFLIGISCLISGSTEDKVSFAMSMADPTRSGTVSAPDMKKVFFALNDVASFFGDPVVSREQITEMTKEIFEAHNVGGTIRYNDSIHPITEHPLMAAFISGQGTERYGQ
jgi:Ca2+-binding EF-hand superfamily protein